MSSLICDNCLHNKYFPPVTFLVRNSPASDPRSESRAGFQDKFHLTPDPDSEQRRKARKRESRHQTSIWPEESSPWSVVSNGHPIVWAGERRWPLSSAPGVWLRLMLIGSPAWFYNFHFYLSPRAKRFRLGNEIRITVLIPREIAIQHAMIDFALVYIVKIFTLGC